MFIVLTF